MTTKEFIIRFDNKEQFDDDELYNIFWGQYEDMYIDPVASTEGDHHRWTYECEKIYEIENRYFSCYGLLALTEMQEDYFDVQPVEVKPVEKVITVTEWEAI